MVESQKIPGVHLGANTGPQVIRIVVKTPWQKEEFLVHRDMPVRELKEHVSRHFFSSPDQVVLVYAGRILKDHKTLGQHGIHLDSNATIYVVIRSPHGEHFSRQPLAAPPGAAGRSAQKPPRSEGPLASDGLRELTATLGLNTANFVAFQSQLLSNPEMMLQLLENPFIQSKLSSPGLRKELVTNSPQVRQVIQKAPEVSHVLSSPEGMRLVVELARNPAAVREIIKSPPQALSSYLGSGAGAASGGDNNSSALQGPFAGMQGLVQKALPKKLGPSLLPGPPPLEQGRRPAQARGQQACPRMWPPRHPGAQDLAAGSRDHSKGESGGGGSSGGSSTGGRGEAGQLASSAVKTLLHQIIRHLLQNIGSGPCKPAAAGQGHGQAPELAAKVPARSSPGPARKPREQQPPPPPPLPPPLQVPALLQQIQDTDVLMASWSPKELQGLLEIQQRLQALAMEEPAAERPARQARRSARRAHSITSLCDILPPAVITAHGGRPDFSTQQILQALVGADFAASAKPASHLRGSSAQPSSKQKRTYKL